MAHSPGFARFAHLVRTILTDRGLLTSPLPIELSGSALSRRELLTGAATLATAAVLPGCGQDDDGTEANLDGMDVEIAVVGAGIAGVHCAMRLHSAGLDVRLYEASKRVGGRMWTSRDGHPDSQLAELGGELIDSNHATLMHLAEELDIKLDDRHEGVPTGDTWWVDGAAVPEETVIEQFSALAEAFADAVIAADSDDEAFTTLDETTLADWLDDNVPVADYAELNAILRSAYRGEFGLEPEEQSALNLLYLIGSDDPDPFRIFGESDERWHTHEGNDTFVTRLAAQIPEGRILFEHELVELRASDTGYELTFTGPDGKVVVRARQVVLAIPWTILRTVELGESGLSDAKRSLIDTLGYGANCKLMGWFSEPVWRTQHQASGSLTTDAAAQQTWDSSIGQSGDAAVLTNFLGGDTAAAMTDETRDDWWTETVLPELDEVWPRSAEAYVPDTLVSMLWPRFKWTRASYTCYLPGQWATWATEGERDGNVHFCGEHCSVDFQGWMEGAAETGALVAATLIMEYGATLPEGLESILEAKLVVEQPSFDGRLSVRPSWRTRRVALSRAAARRRLQSSRRAVGSSSAR